MTTISKFYLRDATTGDTGTLPGATSVGTVSPTVTATGAETNRTLGATKGAAQTNSTLSTSATKSFQANWHRRFCSDPIAAQTIGGAGWTINVELGYLQSNTNSAISVAGCLVVWRPSNGSVVGRVFDTQALQSTPDTTNTTQQLNFSGGYVPATSAVTASDGDILVFEAWTQNTQSMATAYTNNGYYEGTTEGSTSNEAAFLNFSTAITMYSAPAAQTLAHYTPVVNQAVQRGSSY